MEEGLLENLDDNRRRITLQLSLFSAVFDVFVLFRIGKSRLPVELPTCSSFFSFFSVIYLNAMLRVDLGPTDSSRRVTSGTVPAANARKRKRKLDLSKKSPCRRVVILCYFT